MNQAQQVQQAQSVPASVPVPPAGIAPTAPTASMPEGMAEIIQVIQHAGAGVSQVISAAKAPPPINWKQEGVSLASFTAKAAVTAGVVTLTALAVRKIFSDPVVTVTTG